MHRNATVVLVEDDEGVRRMMAVLLVHYGYRVLQAADGEEASMLCEADVIIDLVITDLDMPRLDGLGLLRRLSLKPDPPRVLVCCGSAGIGDLPHLAKPFTPQQLEAAIEKAMLGPPLSPSSLPAEA